MGYSFGGKDDIANFNLYVANCRAPNKNDINASWSGYLGNLGENTCSIDAQVIRKKQWVGLYDKKSKGEINVDSITQPYWPTYWSGIDCNGLVQRVMMAGKTSYESIFGLHVEVDDLKLDHPTASVSHEMSIDKFLLPNVSYEIEVANKKKIKKGDIVRYNNDTHVSMVYSSKWGESRFKHMNYDVINAYGAHNYKNNLTTDDAAAEIRYDFSRKVMVTGDNIAPYGSFGRIKLWY